jgi:hypothetical protein
MWTIKFLSKMGSGMKVGARKKGHQIFLFLKSFFLFHLHFLYGTELTRIELSFLLVLPQLVLYLANENLDRRIL